MPINTKKEEDMLLAMQEMDEFLTDLPDKLAEIMAAQAKIMANLDRIERKIAETHEG
jgi:hypothetical protein